MNIQGALPAKRKGVASLLQEGEALARRGQRQQAQRFFFRVLALDPDNVRALLWMAALAQDPEQSIHYLNRVLRIEPDHAVAREGLQWAKKRLKMQQQQRARQRPWQWVDTALLGGLAVMAVAAFAILFWMAFQTPEVVRAARQSTWTPAPAYTPTMTPRPTYTPTPTLTPPPTSTATPTLPPEPTPTATRVVPGEPSASTPLGGKWIEIELSTQQLRAYEGETLVYDALVSTGVAWYPTPKGEHKIIRKVRSQTMSGVGYSLPNVEFVSYFYKGYAIHGTYWHNNFGQPMSHGCVNMTNADAKWIYEWAPLGTPVRVRE